jgi:hypothetical protein
MPASASLAWAASEMTSRFPIREVAGRLQRIFVWISWPGPLGDQGPAMDRFWFTRNFQQVVIWQLFGLRISHFMDHASHNKIVSLIGPIADDCLRDLETDTEGILGKIFRFSNRTTYF